MLYQILFQSGLDLIFVRADEVHKLKLPDMRSNIRYCWVSLSNQKIIASSKGTGIQNLLKFNPYWDEPTEKEVEDLLLAVKDLGLEDRIAKALGVGKNAFMGSLVESLLKFEAETFQLIINTAMQGEYKDINDTMEVGQVFEFHLNMFEDCSDPILNDLVDIDKSIRALIEKIDNLYPNHPKHPKNAQ